MKKYIAFMLPYLSQIKFSLFVSFSFLLLAVGLEFVHMWVQKTAIDYVVLGQFERMPILIISFVVVIMLIRLSTMGADLLLNRNIANIDADMTKDMYKSIHQLPFSRYKEERIAKYVTHINTDVRQAGQMIAYQIPKGISQIVNVIALIIIIGVVNYILLLIVLSMATLYIFLGKKFYPAIRDSSKEVEKSRTDLIVNIEESISSTRETISFNRIKWERNQYLQVFYKYYQKVMKQERLQNKQFLMSEPLQWGTNLGVLGFGGYLVVTGQMGIGLYTVIFQMSGQLMGNISGIYYFFTSLSHGAAHIDRMKSVLDDVKIKDGNNEIAGPIEQLEMNGVYFSYSTDQQEVLKGISINFPIGSKVAFVGSSGGGKSTIAQLLTRFYEPTKGAIIVNGLDLKSYKESEWTSRVSIVFQEPYLFSDSIKNNLLLGRENIDLTTMERACQAAHIDSYIRSLPDGYNTLIGERGLTLSGGQRQRIAIARALLSEADILILDEATSALDMETERLVQANIDRWRIGKTTIVIAHRLSTVVNADIIYVMDQGNVVEQGSYQQLLNQEGVFTKLIEGQLIS